MAKKFYDDFNESVKLAATHTIDPLYGNLQNIGILLYSLNANQAAYELINQINKFLLTNPYTSVTLFSLTREPPIIGCNCSLYNIHDIPTFKHDIIACDIQAVNYLLTQTDRQFYYYAFDPVLLKASNYKQDVDRVTIIHRRKEYADLCGLKHHEVFVPCFELDKFREILYVNKN